MNITVYLDRPDQVSMMLMRLINRFGVLTPTYIDIDRGQLQIPGATYITEAEFNLLYPDAELPFVVADGRTFGGLRAVSEIVRLKRSLQ